MTLKLHHLRPAPGAKTAKIRVGRGQGGKGKTAGRGTKGTKARYQVAGRWTRAARCRCTCGCPSSRASRAPSGSSTRSSTSTGSVRSTPTVARSRPRSLVAKGAVRDNAPVKVLGGGDVTVALQVSAHAFSASAKDKIAAAGGSTTEL